MSTHAAGMTATLLCYGSQSSPFTAADAENDGLGEFLLAKAMFRVKKEG